MLLQGEGLWQEKKKRGQRGHAPRGEINVSLNALPKGEKCAVSFIHSLTLHALIHSFYFVNIGNLLCAGTAPDARESAMNQCSQSDLHVNGADNDGQQ